MIPQSNTELMQQMQVAVQAAKPLMDAIWKRQQAKGSELGELLHNLRLATCASQELLNRALGNPPAKVGP